MKKINYIDIELLEPFVEIDLCTIKGKMLKPVIRCNCVIYKRCGNPDWGAIPDKEYYVLKILSAEVKKNV